MNIFYLHDDPQTCAQLHCDKHVVKMPLETAQMLCTVYHEHGYEAPYKAVHRKHPCTLWAGRLRSNYAWLWNLGMALCEEYTFRYGKVHKSQYVLETLTELPVFMIGKSITPVSPLPQCMPEQYKQDTNEQRKGTSWYQKTVAAYEDYYRHEKARFCTWKNRPIPKFMEKTMQLQS